MMNRFCLIALAFIGYTTAGLANVAMPFEAQTHLNIGVRLGWNTVSGDPLWGFEASYTYWGKLTHGPVLNLDFRDNGLRIGLGYELVLIPPALGLETGPTIAITDGALEVGWHAAGFIGFLVFIHDQATLLPSGFANELGLTLKAPVPVIEVDYSGSDD